MQQKIEEIILTLQLKPHPEGGFYRETFRVPEATGQGRYLFTTIYYLLPQGHASKLHRLTLDEIWHFYCGGPAKLVSFYEDRKKTYHLGNHFLKGGSPQVHIPAHHWFGVILEPDTEFALFGCTVVPGFDFKNFELISKEKSLDLKKRFPDDQGLIEKLSQERPHCN